MTIDFYQLPFSPPCRPITLLANLLKLSLNTKELDLRNGEHLKPEFLKINPQHTIPTIVDDGKAVWESKAILCYLVNKYAPGHSLYPSDPYKRSKVDAALYFDATSLYSTLANAVYPTIKAGIPFNKDFLPFVQQKLDILNDILEKNHFVAGDELTIADLSIVSTYDAIAQIGFWDVSKYTHIQAWVERLRKHIPDFDKHITETGKVYSQVINEKLKAQK